MVKLPENESYVPLSVGELWARYQRNRNLYGGPSSLIELEEFADIAANCVSTMSSNHPNVRQIAMNRLRQLFNLMLIALLASSVSKFRRAEQVGPSWEFKLRCDVCGTAHYQDEISAPER